MHRLSLLICALAALVLLPSCCTKPCGVKPEDRRSWFLTKIEIDRSNLHNAGSLPIYRREDGSSFGREPVAMGTMQASRDGLWTISVSFQETVVAFSGRSAAHQYEVLSLSGRAQNEGKRIVAQGALPQDVMTGVATEVCVEKVSDTKLRVQPSTKNRKLPYVFIFDSSVPQARPVSIPLL